MATKAIGSDRQEFVADIITGLGRSGQKWLPAKYFYDELGSALFEAITVLPEYGLTRADARLLELHATEIVRRSGVDFEVVELGSGSGKKTRWILEALDAPVYHAIDVSTAALRACADELANVAAIHLHARSYLDGLREVVSARGSEHLLLLFLGSTIGNFERRCAADFLAAVRGLLRPGDSLLLGADLVKTRDRMLVAYDDPAGVTAAFNRNVLARMNRELDADFDVRAFDHEARWDEAERRIEMHLRSRVAQTVRIHAADLTIQFAAGETIWTESSHKYRVEDLARMAESAGFREEARWVDEEWPFAENLWIAE